MVFACLRLSHHGASPLQDGQVHLVTLLDETTTAECRQEVAINLVKLFLGQGLAKEFLDLLFELELAKPCKAGVEASYHLLGLQNLQGLVWGFFGSDG